MEDSGGELAVETELRTLRDRDVVCEAVYRRGVELNGIVDFRDKAREITCLSHTTSAIGREAENIFLFARALATVHRSI